MIMSFVCNKNSNKIQASIHPRDKTVRPQIVKQKDNPKYYQLIKYFNEYTSIGGVLNTSFNLHGFPLVETPDDAIKVLLNSGLKYLVLEDYLIEKYLRCKKTFMRYHLVTSLDINTWKKNDNIVIGDNNLGNNINFSKFQYKILNSSEVLGNSLNSKVEQINKIFSIAFPLICKKLNNFHNCDYSNRYWNIILGNWLFRCISVIVYRFNITKKILSKYNITSASIAFDQTMA